MTEKPSHPHLNEARFSACLDLLARTGTKQVQIRYHDDPRTGETVGRNDPCPCGSGKKWKRCHGA